MSKNLNSELKRKRIIPVIRRSMGSRDHQVHWDVDHIRRGLRTAQITLIICYQIELDKLSIYETRPYGERP
jgi:hypothetical protein